MDELEISGRRYLSTRRAGREHRYHSDYIGQLIRGGKVAGTKVGRAWYVDAASLAEYLGKEIPPPAPLQKKPEPLEMPPAHEDESRIKLSIRETSVQTEQYEQASDNREERRYAIPLTTLTYINADEPLLPQLQPEKAPTYEARMQTYSPAPYAQNKSVALPRARRARSPARTFAILGGIACIVFGSVLMAAYNLSYMLSSQDGRMSGAVTIEH